MDHAGDTYLLNQQNHMPSFGKTSRAPAFFYQGTARLPWFEKLVAGDTSLSWSQRWVLKALRSVPGLSPESAGIVIEEAVRALTTAGFLEERNAQSSRVGGIRPAQLLVTHEVSLMTCQRCGHSVACAGPEQALWEGTSCLRASCRGTYTPQPPIRDYIGDLYRSRLKRGPSSRATPACGRARMDQAGRSPQRRWQRHCAGSRSGISLRLGVDPWTGSAQPRVVDAAPRPLNRCRRRGSRGVGELHVAALPRSSRTDIIGMIFSRWASRPVGASSVRASGADGRWPLCALADALLCLGACAAAEVKIETGDRKTDTGDTVSYALYLPLPSAEEATVLQPAVILLHGFARHYRYHAGNAVHLAEHGFVVLTPNLVSLMAGRSAQMRNVQIAADHIAWLAKRGEMPGDSLYHRIDPLRIGLAGHSAGGAVVFEAAVAAQSGRYRAAAVCLLDAVPWEATLQAAPALHLMPLCSLRSEPSAWNARAQVLRLLKAIPFPVDDVRIVGASHVDPENPTDVAADWFAGGVHPKCQALYQRLMLQFFEQALGNSPSGPAAGRYLQSIQELQKEGLITVAGQQPEPQGAAAPPAPGPL